MKPDGPIKLVSQLLDLPIIDSDGNYCGVVDDVDLSGKPGAKLTVRALLVGPGAYSGRLPRWIMSIIRMIVGDRAVQIPWSKVDTIRSAVRLTVPGRELGLLQSEARAERWIPRKGAM
jgi:sporulation protein YlmC with PRC-barrel domain